MAGLALGGEAQWMSHIELKPMPEGDLNRSAT
jgi:hypothetical protein